MLIKDVAVDPLVALRAKLAALEARSVLRCDEPTPARPPVEIAARDDVDRRLAAACLEDDARLAEAASQQARGVMGDDRRFRPRKRPTRHDVEACELTAAEPATPSPPTPIAPAAPVSCEEECPAEAEAQAALPPPPEPTDLPSDTGHVAPPPAVTATEMPAPRAVVAGGGRAPMARATAGGVPQRGIYLVLTDAGRRELELAGGLRLDDAADGDGAQVLIFPGPARAAPQSRASPAGYGRPRLRGYG